LRYIDDHQKRAGTVTALVARGLADAVPSPPALPVTVSPPMTSAPPATVRDAEVKKYKDDGVIFHEPEYDQRLAVSP